MYVCVCVCVCVKGEGMRGEKFINIHCTSHLALGGVLRHFCFESLQ